MFAACGRYKIFNFPFAASNRPVMLLVVVIITDGSYGGGIIREIGDRVRYSCSWFIAHIASACFARCITAFVIFSNFFVYDGQAQPAEPAP